jgi:hypothetical protein
MTKPKRIRKKSLADSKKVQSNHLKATKTDSRNINYNKTSLKKESLQVKRQKTDVKQSNDAIQK